MDISRIYNTVDALEGKIDHLLEVCNNLKNKNNELQDRIEDLEQELQNKIEAEGRQAEQKEMVQAKIDSLLVKLNDFSELS
ncbi:MAG: cell division protein ZapB [Proteobacteria bacterium]|nr:cell division protein ZapB [Pseudomonadota bacterium]